MHNGYVLTLAAIESRLYTNESDSIFMRWPTAEKELPRGNHTPDGLSATCLHFMEDIMTRTGRPNHKWDSFLFLHFGGWDFLIDYARKDAKRRGYLLRCEEKGYSVSWDRVYFDECLVSERPVKGVIAAVPSTAMKCIVDANVYLVRNFCGLYSDAGMDTLCSEIRRFLETGPDEEKTLEICTSAFGPDYPANACTLSNLGILEDMEGNYQEARSCYERALRIQSSVAGPDHPHCADILHNLAVSYIEEAFAEADGEDANDRGAGDRVSTGSAADLTLLRKALEQDSRALSIARSRLGDGHQMTILLEDSIRWLNEKLGIET